MIKCVKNSAFAMLAAGILLGCQQYHAHKYSGMIEGCESAWFSNEQIVAEIKEVTSVYRQKTEKFVAIKSCGLYSLQMFGVTDAEGFFLEIGSNNWALQTYRIEDAERFFSQILKFDNRNIENYYAHDIDVDSLRENRFSGLFDIVDLFLLVSAEKEIAFTVVNGYMWDMDKQKKKDRKKLPKSIVLVKRIQRLLKDELPKSLYSREKFYSPDLPGLPDAFANPPKNSRFFELDILLLPDALRKSEAEPFDPSTAPYL